LRQAASLAEFAGAGPGTVRNWADWHMKSPRRTCAAAGDAGKAA
jgi:hypothetical protein